MAASVIFILSVLCLVLSISGSGLKDGRMIIEDLDIGAIPIEQLEKVERLIGKSKLSCEKKTYEAYIERKDEKGRKCWDNLHLPACWGRCDSMELADWRFPYKLQIHPVCNFGTRIPAVVKMRNCEKEVTPGTELFSYLKPINCVCKSCNRADTNCGWLSDTSIVESLISPPRFEVN